MIKLDRLYGGNKFAITLSYDDGNRADKRLIEILNRYGFKGTFHLNSGLLPFDGKIHADEIKEVYQGHEVSCHGVFHRSMTTLPPQNMLLEFMEDRRVLEEASDSIVRGMSYANGVFSDEAVNALKNCGIVYGRTTQSHHGFHFPENFLKWHPTCHHNDCLADAENFLVHHVNREYSAAPRLLYVWGHSCEFDRDDNWNIMEEFCKKMSNLPKVWYATNIEIYEYITAQKQLVISADNKRVYNPTAISIWFTDDEKNEKEYVINPGETLIIS